ncbi:MAG: hypothetical protein PGN21_03525 [Sphingomonas paucimobilis]
MHDEVANNAVERVNCTVPRSAHSMMSSRPDVVIKAVARMVDAVRGRRRIASDCGDLGRRQAIGHLPGGDARSSEPGEIER